VSRALTKPAGKTGASDKVLKKLVKAPESINQIYAIAESLFMRDPNVRMTGADIEQVNEYLRQTENEIDQMKKQLWELASSAEVFRGETVPPGF
jgi:septal ring factor EnvC (AmiA/AmiB activator)